jgi:hypothetical protein
MPAHSASAASSVKSSRPAACALRCQQGVEGERLRGLDAAQCGAVERAHHMAGRIDFLDRVGHRNAGDRGAGGARHDGARDQRRGGEWARGVVHQHDRGAIVRQRLEAGADRGLSRGAAECGGQQAQPPGGLGVQGAVVAMDHRLHPGNLRMVGEDRQALVQHRDIAERAVLLRQIPAGAQAAPARHHDRCHVFRHLGPTHRIAGRI